MANSCNVCNAQLVPSAPSIVCTACQGHFHGSCVNVTANDIEYLNERNEPWNCSFCLSSVRVLRSNSGGSTSKRGNSQVNVTEALGQINVSLSKIFSELASINTTQKAIAADVARCNATLEAHTIQIEKNSTHIKDCTAKIATVSVSSGMVAAEVNSLRSKVASIESNIASQEINCLDEESVREAAERVRRSSNLILRGLPENISAEDEPTQDRCRIEEILRCVDPLSVSTISAVCRLGPTRDTPRPIKICFNDSRAPIGLLRNKSKLLSSRFKKVSLSDDKTPRQLKQLTDLRQELKRRQESGDTGCTIRYIKGTPTIVTSSDSKNQTLQ